MSYCPTVKLKNKQTKSYMLYIHGQAQDRGNSSVLALELLRFLAKPSIWTHTDM